MATQTRRPAGYENSIKMGSGVYLAKVVSVMDPTFGGKLKVTLLQDQGNTIGDENQTYVLSYASPFFGQTPYEAMGNNNKDFNDTQKSYGMWFVPPDIGVTVLCLFANGDPGNGYWFACLPPNFSNHMVPAIGATTVVDLTAEDKKKYNTDRPLPVAEINKRYNAYGSQGEGGEQISNPELLKKAVHPIADRFLEQGLLQDDVRGPTTTTSRRQVPNSVFGISTPGPLDWRTGSKRMNTGSLQNSSLTGVAVSRLGGTQFYIDDGDDRLARDTSASEGPVRYIDIIAGKYLDGETANSPGRVDIPYNEHTRLRTRTGHQILLHNSEDLIYIGNSKGTAWVELTSNGKIDIYAADSISIHTETDLNIKADRDINIEAGRNINMKATAEYQSKEVLHRRDDSSNPVPKILDERGYEAGRIQIESAFNFNLLIGANGRIETRNYQNEQGVPVDGDLDISVIGSTRVTTGYGIVAPHDYELKVFGDTLIKTTGNLDLNTTGNNAYTAGGTTDILSGGNHTETAAEIHMNGPEARKAEVAEQAKVITDLVTHINTYNDYSKDWALTNYNDGSIQSIMRRVPMHEPWPLHENLSPSNLTPSNTDRESE